jgi:hypothetical protein
MAAPLDQPQFDQAIGQQAQRPALRPLGRCTTRQGHQVGFHLPGKLLGGTRCHRLLVERRLEAPRDKAAPHIADRVPMTAQGLGNGLIVEGVSVVTSQAQQNSGPRLCAGRGAARPDQGVQGHPLIVH